MSGLCTIKDEFVNKSPHWVAVVGDGIDETKLWQDDNRASVYPYSAWARLRKYCLEHKLKIKKFSLYSPCLDKEVSIDLEGCEALYFANLAVAFFNGNGDTLGGFTVGKWAGGYASIKKYVIPTLNEILEESGPRPIRADSPALIPVG